MIYTSNGIMTHQEVQETLKDMDMGSTTIYGDDVPVWFKVERCPCGVRVDDHDSVTVQDASDEIFACSEGWTEPAPAEDYVPW